MKTKAAQRSPFNAWVATLPLALGLPAAVQILIWGTSQWRGLDRLNRYEIKGSAIILGVTILVHFLAYVVTGLPIFLSRYERANSPIWMADIGIFLGAAVGALAVFFLLGIFDRTGTTLFQPFPYLIGAGYGVATAIAVLFRRPTRD